MDVLLLTHAFSCTSTELETETRVPDNQEPQPIASTSETIPSPFIGIAGISERKLGILRQDLEFYHVQPFDPLDRRCIEEEGATAENEEPQWRIAVAVKNSGKYTILLPA